MAIKIGGSYVSETAYAQAKTKIEAEQNSNGTTSKKSLLSYLQSKYENLNITSNTQPFSSNGTNNIAISSKIINDMAKDPNKRLEYEALMIDCQSAENSLASAFKQKGTRLVNHGFIIGADGGLSSWGVITTDNSNVKSTFNSFLDKGNKHSWNETIMRNITKDENISQYDKHNSIDYKA